MHALSDLLLSEPPVLDDAVFARSRAHQRRAHGLIPGGAHTYARGDDQMPQDMPLVLARGEGCRVWDVDGNAFVEYGMGLRAVTLGHAEPRVVRAAHRAMAGGSCFSRPAAIELDAAEAFLGCVGAEMVKFCKDGSDATTAAVKLARAHTGRDHIAVCADHPFLSTDDWFIGTTPMDAGIPASTKALTHPFRYGDAAGLEALLATGEIACVVMEAARGIEDEATVRAFLRDVRRLCDRHDVVFVLDEMITGFRWHLGGAQAEYGIAPDLSCFGKALANGFAVSALAGRSELMELGGLRTDRERVFLLSATHGAETHGLAAAIETMRIYREEGVIETLHRQGARLRAGLTAEAERLGLADHFAVLGRDSNLVYATRDAEGAPSQEFRTLFLQETTRRGLLAPSFVVSAAHTDSVVDETVEKVAAALVPYRDALDGGVARFLAGRAVQPVFRKHNATPAPAEPARPASGAIAAEAPSEHTPVPSASLSTSP